MTPCHFCTEFLLLCSGDRIHACVQYVGCLLRNLICAMTCRKVDHLNNIFYTCFNHNHPPRGLSLTTSSIFPVYPVSLWYNTYCILVHGMSMGQHSALVHKKSFEHWFLSYLPSTIENVSLWYQNSAHGCCIDCTRTIALCMHAEQ